MRHPPSASRLIEPVSIAQAAEFDEIIDVRSEGEFADDHIPGAINCAVLNNEERVRVGTLYKQVSKFDAKKIGAALVGANIARHLSEKFLDRPRDWRPLVYCWRGGERSGSLSHVLAQVGWRVGRLEGGYKAFRRAVIADLAQWPEKFQFRVLCGVTGTGKSRLLQALSHAGAQVLDLEQLAAHRGSVLGNLPDSAQPPQKMFESLLWDALKNFDPARPVYIESESRKIGTLALPEALIKKMWTSEPLLIEAPLAVRVELLMQDYAHFFGDTATLNRQLDCLTILHGRETIAHWKSLAETGNWAMLVEELLVKHYDPAYKRSIVRHYPALGQARKLIVGNATQDCFADLAKICMTHHP